jgi:hypothetical protein
VPEKCGSWVSFGSGCIPQTGANGNISADPLFTSASDFQLQPTSPAIDAGSNSASHLPTQDIAGNDRILPGPGRCTPIVDMGAYEFSRPSSLIRGTALLCPSLATNGDPACHLHVGVALPLIPQ